MAARTEHATQTGELNANVIHLSVYATRPPKLCKEVRLMNAAFYFIILNCHRFMTTAELCQTLNVSAADLFNEQKFLK